MKGALLVLPERTDVPVAPNGVAASAAGLSSAVTWPAASAALPPALSATKGAHKKPVALGTYACATYRRHHNQKHPNEWKFYLALSYKEKAN
jgi:hypothetical protein